MPNLTALYNQNISYNTIHWGLMSVPHPGMSGTSQAEYGTASNFILPGHTFQCIDWRDSKRRENDIQNGARLLATYMVDIHSQECAASTIFKQL